MEHVTSTELQRNLGKIMSKAKREAVTITSRGREELVICDVEEYKRLLELDQQAFYPHELPEDVIEGLVTHPIAKASCQFEHEDKAE